MEGHLHHFHLANMNKTAINGHVQSFCVDIRFNSLGVVGWMCVLSLYDGVWRWAFGRLGHEAKISLYNVYSLLLRYLEFLVESSPIKKMKLEKAIRNSENWKEEGGLTGWATEANLLHTNSGNSGGKFQVMRVLTCLYYHKWKLGKKSNGKQKIEFLNNWSGSFSELGFQNHKDRLLV